jgi:FKBP-type peptidyl-prolyl cis-trans isomerase SlyD
LAKQPTLIRFALAKQPTLIRFALAKHPTLICFALAKRGNQHLMKIEKDKVVGFHYTLHDLDGNELENSHTRAPQMYLHGHKGLIPGLETAMENKQVGDQFDVTVASELAYGNYVTGRVQRVPLKRLAKAGKLSVGQWVQVEGDKGVSVATVVKIGMTVADLDLNHPLAGKALKFNVEIKSIRDASKEELDHGHAHGDGGVQH